MAITLFAFWINIASNSVYNSSSSGWTIQNQVSLTFNQDINFTDPPHPGVTTDKILVGYWNMNEGNGTIIHDNSGNGIDGTLTGVTWADGKYNEALNFNSSSNKVDLTNSDILSVGSGLYNGFTILAWVKTNQTNGSYRGVISKSYSSPYGEYALTISGGNISCYFGGIGWQQYSQAINDGAWHRIGYYCDFLNNTGGIIVDDKVAVTFTGITRPANNSLSVLLGSHSTYYSGFIDDVSIYNRPLSPSEIVTTCIMGQQPDSTTFSNFYSFSDINSNSTMLIFADSNRLNSGVNVSCTQFFNDKQLIFTANDSVTLNLWTNLGPPVYTTGSWNAVNYTTILPLNSSTIGKLSWKPGAIPKASTFSTNSTHAGNVTNLSLLWTDEFGLSGGGFIFCTNNSGQWENSSWTLFTINPDWGNVSLTLTNNTAVIVGVKGYANDSLNLWGVSDIYTITPNISIIPSSTLTLTLNPTLIITATTPPETSEPTSKPSPNSNPYVVNPTPVSTASPEQTSDWSNLKLTIITASVVFLVTLLLVALKSGALKVEVLTKQSTESLNDDST